MSQNEPLIGQQTQSKGYLKRFGAPLAVAGCSLAVALLLAGKNTSKPEYVSPAVTEFWAEPDTFLEAPTDLFAESCSVNWDRMRSQANGAEFLNSGTFQDNMNNDGLWEDPTFPADSSSLYWEDQDHPSQIQAYKNKEQSPGLRWYRPEELKGYENGASLWGHDGIQVRTSEQGDLGDCWFLSSATAVVESGHYRMKNLFTTQSYPSNGAVQVHFYIRASIRVAVTVDTRIPVEWYGPDYESPYLFLNNSPSPQDAWWLVFLEKAMAKLNVNYANLNGGYPGEALRAMTGMPTSFYSGNRLMRMTDEQLWDLMTDSMNKNYPMVAGTSGKEINNLVSGHAYTVLGTVELRNPDGSLRVKLVKMRNPWGKYEYTGPWAQKSDQWTEDFKRQADFSEATEGIFFTPLDIWREEYEAFTICHYNDDWSVTSIGGNHKLYESDSQVQEWLRFDNPVTQDIIVECEQYTSRYWPAGTQCENEKWYPKNEYQSYLYNNDQYPKQITTHPGNSACIAGYGGQVLLLNNLAPGTYNIGVWDYNGESDRNRGIWEMRTYASQQAVYLHERPDPYS